MVIARGADWGHAGSRPASIITAANDADLAAIVAERRSLEPSQPPVTTVSGGDLLRTLGGARPPEAETWWFSVDLGWVDLGVGPEIPFVAHLVARRALWRSDFAVAMNAAWLGDRYLGPRAHPNDGLLDVTRGRLDWRERFEANRRSRLGTHVPHPALETDRTPRDEWEFRRPISLRVDGVLRGAATHVRVQIQPDAFWVVL